MSEARIKRQYTIVARVYDPLVKLWTKVVGTEVEKELNNFLREHLDETSTILELGCGTARNLEHICSLNLKFKKYLGLDFSPQMLAVARSKFSNNSAIEFKEQDITLIDYPIEKFDIILCTWVLSHFESPSVLVNKAQALLEHGGRFFLIFFTKPKWYINFWLYPLATYLFSAVPVSEKEIRKFNNVRVRHSHASNITTCVEVYDNEAQRT